MVLGLSQSFAAVESESVKVSKQDLLYTTEALTMVQLEECESIYEDYTTLEENVFTQRYLYHKIAGNCVMLFDDPVWETEGDERYNVLSQRLTELVIERYDQERERKAVFFIDPKSVLELPKGGSYLFTFEGCTGDQTIKASDILVVSDVEMVLLVGFAEQDREISPERCGIFEVQIKADDPESIRILIAGTVVEFSKQTETSVEPMKAKPTLRETRTVETTQIRKSDLLFSTEPLSQNQLQDCEQAYSDYISLDQGQFSTRYLHHRHMGNCVMLFDDPVWNEKSDFRYQDLSDRLAELMELREEMLMDRQFSKMRINPHSVEELEDGLYLYSFEACTGNQPLILENIVAASDIEQVSLVKEKTEGTVIPPGICRSMEIRIHADDPDSVRVMIPGMDMGPMGHAPMGMDKEMMGMDKMMDSHMSPRAQMRHGTAASDVSCMEGHQLIFKSRDGSPGCVSSHAFDRLVERGWGRP